MAVETEIKIYVSNLAAMQQRLEKASLHKPRVYEKNVRYDDGSLTQRGVVLRLRQDDRVRLTYKEPSAAQSAGTSSRLELETEIGDFDTMDEILRKLGYATSLIYEKYRTTYKLGAAEIVLDEMPYGNFIEIEGTPTAIEAAVSALGMEKAARILGSYTELFERVKRALELDVRDLTFANFEGIEVDGAVFR